MFLVFQLVAHFKIILHATFVLTYHMPIILNYFFDHDAERKKARAFFPEHLFSLVQDLQVRPEPILSLPIVSSMFLVFQLVAHFKMIFHATFVLMYHMPII